MEAAQESVRNGGRARSLAELVRSQQEYYRRRGRSDYPQWIESYMAPVARQVETIVRGLAGPRGVDLRGEVLELACGSGFFTRMLSRVAAHVTAVDGAPEMLAHVRALALPNVEPRRADLFAWEPYRRWDAVFMANWLGHVPVEEFGYFWRLVDRALAPGGVVVVLDVTQEELTIERGYEQEGGIPVVPRVAEGEEYKVIKYYWRPMDLLAALEQLGWRGTAVPIGHEVNRGFVVYRLERAAG